MRITNSMMVSQFLSDANSSLNRVSKYQNQVDSTKKITRISDDPLATITMLKARNKLSNLELYKSNISTASSYLTEAESSVSELNEIIKSAYDEIMSASSGSKTQDELNIIAEELENLKNELISVGNTSIGASYIFGGYNFTGSTNGVSKTAPFSIDEATGDLIYNGINLSKFSWKNDYENSASLMPGFGDTILDINSQVTDSSEYYARETLCANASKALANLLSCGKTALNAAKEFGLDENIAEYQELSKFVDDMSEIADRLNAERSKQLSGDYILESDPSIVRNADNSINYEFYEEQGITVMTDDEFANCFSLDNIKAILGDAEALFEEQYDIDGEPIGSMMEQKINDLAGKMTIGTDDQNALDAEKAKQVELRIGASQTVEFTFTGIDLMGVGSDNIYHLFDKCIKMLRGEDGMNTDGLKGMITALQNKQSDTLNLQTKIGATQNRLELINSRYDSSKINYTQMRSDAEDADMAEALMNFTTAKTVYSAALAAGAKIIQISLIDFLK